MSDAADVEANVSTSINETVGTTKQLTNRSRCQRVIDQASSASRKKWTLDERAVEFINTYSVDMANKILEDAAVIAKHRNSTEVDAMDVNLILIKKYNIVMPPTDGVARVTLHAQTIKASHSAPKPVAQAPAGSVGSGAEYADAEKDGGGKRKRKKD